ncbi:MAG: histidine kinase [Candidatus Azobacteroides sp.]|nr:histidine kinase [Candidatus Azobacteroides sp.]
MLLWFSGEKEMIHIERGICFLSYAILSILLSLSFSKTMFQKTVADRKTTPFILKFVMMTVFLATGYALLNHFFCFLEWKGIFPSTHFSQERLPLFKEIISTLPGSIFANIIFCVILLYYEYSELKTANLTFELKILHAQINPHFMFNVLNYLYILVRKDPELAATLLLKYSDVLRYQLYSTRNDMVPLENEVQFLKDFIDVEKFRWEDKLDVICSWDIENGKTEIPPLLLIPFVENAFKHVSRSTFQKGYIYISFKQKGKKISLEVENSKSDKPVKKSKSNGIGLENIKARLEILYGRHYSLTLKDMGTVYLSNLQIYL